MITTLNKVSSEISFNQISLDCFSNRLYIISHNLKIARNKPKLQRDYTLIERLEKQERITKNFLKQHKNRHELLMNIFNAMF